MIPSTESFAIQQSAVQSIQTQSLDKCLATSGSARSREEHGRALAKKFVNGLSKTVVQFISELADEITEVRRDFAVKPKDELICGVATFTEYCTAVLGYSIRHIDRILEGHNPALSDAENADARQRKAKRKLDAKVKRTQNASPIRPKTNAEVLAETLAAKAEENKVVTLQKQVAVLTQRLQENASKLPGVSESQADDSKKIYASEVQRLETEIAKLKQSLQTLTNAYDVLHSDAVRLATTGMCGGTTEERIAAARKFLKKHGGAA